MTESSDSASKALRVNDNGVVGVVSRVDEMFENLFKSKKLKNDKSEISTHFSDIRAIGEPIFLTLNVKKTFNLLKQAFIKALIFRHFDLKCHIRIETNVSGYAIGGVFS